MTAVSATKERISFVMAACGLALLVAAPLIGRHWGRQDDDVYAANFILWIMAAAGLLILSIRRDAPLKTTARCALVLGAFIFAAFSQEVSDSGIMTQRSLSLAGFALLMAGFGGWRRAHPFFARLQRGLERIAALPSWLFVGKLYVVFLMLAVFFSWYCFSFFPTYVDSISQYVHGKIVAGGHLYAPVHPLHKSFYIPMFIADGDRWYSQYEPMHVFLLALGHLAGAPWLVNPTLGALTLVTIYALARRIGGESTARLSALLTLCCPFVVFMSAEYMNHATSLFFTALFLLAYVELCESLGKPKSACFWALACAMALSGIMLTRPLTALGVGLPFLLYLFYLFCRNARLCFLPCFVMGSVLLSALAFQGWYNLQLTGNVFVFPYGKYSQTNLPGFDAGHPLWDGLLKAQDEWSRMNSSLFEWTLPAMAFIFLACLQPLKNRYLRLLLAMIVGYTLVNLANRWHNFVWGPRYLYELSPALIILTAVGMRRLPALLRLWHIALPPPRARRGMLACALCIVFAASWVHRMPEMIDMYANHFFDNHPQFYFSLLAQAKKPALVFIETPEQSEDKQKKFRWVAHDMPPQDGAPVIFALDKGEEDNRKLMAYYPARNAYMERGGLLFPADKTPQPPQEK